MSLSSHLEAEDEFRRARRRSVLSSIFSRVTGRSDALLSLADAKELFGTRDESYSGRKVIRIDEIVGSEERYQDFNRHFLPKKSFLARRWQSISIAYQGFITLPPILVYELGGLYFVRDGNHRVAVAKRRGIEFIEAEVTTLTTDITVPPVASREELRRAIIDFEHERFLELLPTSEIRFTTMGRYDDLAVHISGHRALLSDERGKKPSVEDATTSWYQDIYLPISQFIRDSGVLLQHPDRTNADFYVWLVRHWDDAASIMSQQMN